MSETPHGGPTHGGPDAGLEIRFDFSTNAHPLGANPRARSAVEKCDRTRYPDPSYARLRALLGAFHNVVPQRIVVGASASELIWRLTHAGKLGGATDVITDERTFGEYRRAALGIGLAVASTAAAWRTSSAALHWLCDPDSPSGEPRDEAVRGALPAATGRVSDLVIVDLAYQPFRALMTESGEYPGLLSTAWADDVVQLWSPNKLHGLTGVRGAYLVLPVRAHPLAECAALCALAPSWVLGADGVAMLQAHADPKSILHLRRGLPLCIRGSERRPRVGGGWHWTNCRFLTTTPAPRASRKPRTCAKSTM